LRVDRGIQVVPRKARRQITRTVYAEMPPRVEYELTPLGHTLFEPLAESCAWNAEHGQAVARAREEHAKRV
jgi:DNA-binding HxlR family transcriptional regulator